MANEISIQFSGSIKNGNLYDKFGPESGNFKLDQATVGGPSPGMISVGTSEEVITFTDITAPTLVVMTNLDATNYVEYGPTSAGALVNFGKLLPGGKPNVVTLTTGVTLRMKANTAACKVLIKGYEL